jgi:hypothetical protein
MGELNMSVIEISRVVQEDTGQDGLIWLIEQP